MSIQITSDWSWVEREFARLQALPGGEALGVLDAIILAGYAATQGAVHIITGRLKESGRHISMVVGKEWQGEIHYGTPGVWDTHHHHYGPEVIYAMFEQRRDGTHDFMSPLFGLDDVLTEAMIRILRGSP